MGTRRFEFEHSGNEMIAVDASTFPATAAAKDLETGEVRALEVEDTVVYEPERNFPDELIRAIKAGQSDLVDELLPQCIPLDEELLMVAEKFGEDGILSEVLGYITTHGLKGDHDFPNQLHWLVAKEMERSALLLIEMAVEVGKTTIEDDFKEKYHNMSLLQHAQKMGLKRVVRKLEELGRG